jgi:hypothetical protein
MTAKLGWLLPPSLRFEDMDSGSGLLSKAEIDYNRGI